MSTHARSRMLLVILVSAHLACGGERAPAGESALRGRAGAKADQPDDGPGSGPNLFVFRRGAKLLDRSYAVVGCARAGVVIEAPGWIPYPKGPDGKPLRDPDDDGVLSALYEIVFSEDQPCGDGFVASKGAHYWVSPAALAPQVTSRPAHEPELLGLEVSGSGCPDRASVGLTGTTSANDLDVMYHRMLLRRGGSEARTQALDCKVQIRLRVPKAGTVRRFRSVTAYHAWLDPGARTEVHSRVLLSGVEVGKHDPTHDGATDDSFTLAIDRELPALGFCDKDVELVIEQQLSVAATATPEAAPGAFEVSVDTSDYWLDLAACP